MTRTAVRSIGAALKENQDKSTRNQERCVHSDKGSDRGSAVAYRGLSKPVNARFSCRARPTFTAERSLFHRSTPPFPPQIAVNTSADSRRFPQRTRNRVLLCRHKPRYEVEIPKNCRFSRVRTASGQTRKTNSYSDLTSFCPIDCHSLLPLS